MGTIISEHHLQRIENMVKRTNGTVLTGGQRMSGMSFDGIDFSKGCFFPPTVVSDVNMEDELWWEEIFGPVVVVARFSVDS